MSKGISLLMLLTVGLVLTTSVYSRGLSANVVETYDVGSFFSRTDVGIMTEWLYPVSIFGFGVGIVFDGPDYDLWISDFSDSIYGLYEITQTGDLGGGFIETTDLDATDDLGYFEDEEGFIVGDYVTVAIETYTEAGGFEASIAGPAGWPGPAIFGVAFNNDDSIVYVADTAGRIAYGTMNDLTSAVTWTDLGIVIPDYAIPGMGYYEDDYLFVVARGTADRWIYVYDTTNGVPDTSTPAFEYDITTALPTDINGCEWDGDYLWVYGRENDYMYKLALDGISPDTGIQPMSFGGIKASFK